MVLGEAHWVPAGHLSDHIMNSSLVNKAFSEACRVPEMIATLFHMTCCVLTGQEF